MTRPTRERTLLDVVVDRLVRSRLYVAIAFAYVTGGLGLGVTLLASPFDPNSGLAAVGIVLLCASFVVFLYVGVTAPTDG